MRLLLALALFAGEAHQGDFSVLSTVSVDENVVVEADLHFPAGYHPNSAQMGANLVAYEGMGASPFALVGTAVQPAEQEDKGMMKQHMAFTLSPQIEGRHLLSFREVEFDPEGAGKSVYVPSDVLSAAVTMPQGAFQFEMSLYPPLPLSQQIPVALSASNRQTYLQSSVALEANQQALLSALQQKRFPWFFLFAILVVAIAVVLVWNSPDEALQARQDQAALQREAAERLKRLAAAVPQEGAASQFFLRLQGALCDYLDAAYRVGVATATVEELSRRSAAPLSEEAYQGVIRIFTVAEGVKYARKEVEPQECRVAVQIIKKLLAEHGTIHR